MLLLHLQYIISTYFLSQFFHLIPIPINNKINPIVTPLVSAFILLIQKSPAIKKILPKVGNNLYFPVLLITIPQVEVEAIIPIVNGSICIPEDVGEYPFAIWRKTGVKVNVESKTTPERNPIKT